MSYVDLHRQFVTDIDAEMDAVLESLGPSSESVRNAMSGLLRHQQMKYPLSVLPMLVHAVDRGDPGPAAPLSAVHLLWWTSACYLDDLADGQEVRTPDGLDGNAALLAAVIMGQSLAFRVVQSQRLPETMRNALTAEIAGGWIDAVEGQMRDMRGDLEGAGRNSVADAYRRKSGAPFRMITAMAAIWAGADGRRIQLWREFGDVFGVLWQLFNDQEDILSGRNEDLRNGTVTYLLACAVEEAASGATEHVLALCAAARTSGRARQDLTKVLLAPAVLRRYRKDLGTFRDEAHRLLGELGGDETYLTALRDLVDQAAGMHLEAASKAL
ncbi:polyprenyl synthetase family protein [Streptomyces sp. NPDC002845]